MKPPRRRRFNLYEQRWDVLMLPRDRGAQLSLEEREQVDIAHKLWNGGQPWGHEMNLPKVLTATAVFAFLQEAGKCLHTEDADEGGNPYPQEECLSTWKAIYTLMERSKAADPPQVNARDLARSVLANLKEQDDPGWAAYLVRRVWPKLDQAGVDAFEAYVDRCGVGALAQEVRGLNGSGSRFGVLYNRMRTMAAA